MTLTSVEILQLPSSNEFLNSICPGITHLDHNVHFSLEDEFNEEPQNALISADWPLVGNLSTSTSKLRMHPTYLNIARPPLNAVQGSNESTTYVSLPYHITNFFDKTAKYKDLHRLKEGGMHIGANVNPLVHDPFKLINLNPGCLSTILELDNITNTTSNLNANGRKNTFNKLTSNFNKLLKITNSSASSDDQNSNTHSLLSFLPDNKSNSNANAHIFERILDYNQDSINEISSPNTSKLLISCHVNVLNIISIDNDSNYKNTHEITSDTTSLPLNEETISEGCQFQKIIENPLLRIQFRQNLVITSLKAFTNVNQYPIIVIGLGSGEVVMINLSLLTYQVFYDLNSNNGIPDCALIHSSPFSNYSSHTVVTSLDIITNSMYEFLIVAGYSNGEVAILNPFANYSDDKPKFRYTKRVVGREEHVTYFKKFDLSPFITSVDQFNECPSYLIGHFKVSHKPITSITSTIPYITTNNNQPNPMLLSIASDDGLVRFFDLLLTHNLNYGDIDNPLNNNLITDVIPNYFHSGITSIEFSPDFKFFCVLGKGDLIEIFKMSYYNINGFLCKSANSHHPNMNVNGGSTIGRRSRSGTVNSTNSGSCANVTVNNQFLSPISTTLSNNYNPSKIDTTLHGSSSNINVNGDSGLYPLITKDIKIVARLKGHTNTPKTIKFIKSETDLENSDLSGINPAYKLMSCGYDGKVIIWEFDYKALPKVKKHHSSACKLKKRRSSHVSPQPTHPQFKSKAFMAHSPNAMTTNKKSSSVPIKPNQGFHARNKSLTQQFDETMSPALSMTSFQFNNVNPSLHNLGGGGVNNMSSILNPTTQGATQDNNLTENVQVILSLYKSLYDVRLKRHYTKLLMEQQGNNTKPKRRFSTIIHPIVNDILVPSIEIPLLALDLSHWVKDGKIDNFHLSGLHFWCFGKNGDIFKYKVKER